ncbi:MAG: CpsB/CapC family capsule biosynthesis tyrosine phosphatase [Emergencia sp.]
MESGFFDLHTHILPGVDDGAESAEQALAMLQILYAEGVGKILLTPHFGIYNENCGSEEFQSVFQNVREAFFASCPDMELYLGNEIFWGPETIPALQSGRALRLADTDYVLIEFHPDEEFTTLERAVQNLTASGYRPVIAHPERYFCLRKHPADTGELVYRGARIQINSRTLLKGPLDSGGRMIRYLLREQLVHFVGSDCHNDTNRKPQMRVPAERLQKLAGSRYAEKILKENGERLLRNEPIEI